MKNAKKTTIKRATTTDVKNLKAKAIKKTKIKPVSPLLNPATYGKTNVDNMVLVSKNFFKRVNSFDTKIKAVEVELINSLIVMIEQAKKNHYPTDRTNLQKAVYKFSEVQYSEAYGMRVKRLCEKALYCTSYKATISEDAEVISKMGSKISVKEIDKAMKKEGVQKPKNTNAKNKTATLTETNGAVELLITNKNLVKNVDITRLEALQSIIEDTINQLDKEVMEEANPQLVKVGEAEVKLSKTAFA